MAANSEAFFIDFRIMARIYIYIYINGQTILSFSFKKSHRGRSFEPPTPQSVSSGACCRLSTKGKGASAHLNGCKKKSRGRLSAAFSFVENIGFEPMTSCMPCKRSSQLS